MIAHPAGPRGSPGGPPRGPSGALDDDPEQGASRHWRRRSRRSARRWGRRGEGGLGALVSCWHLGCCRRAVPPKWARAPRSSLRDGEVSGVLARRIPRGVLASALNRRECPSGTEPAAPCPSRICPSRGRRSCRRPCAIARGWPVDDDPDALDARSGPGAEMRCRAEREVWARPLNAVHRRCRDEAATGSRRRRRRARTGCRRGAWRGLHHDSRGPPRADTIFGSVGPGGSE
jgi:hypothetical protein